MIPLIVVSRQPEKLEEYIQKFIKDNAIRTYNIYSIKPLKTEITIDQIRSITHEIITQASEMRLFVCYSFDNANLEAQNAFLKTLEEKHIQNHFILLASNAERIIPTIRSRSKIIPLDSHHDTIHIRPETLNLLNRVESSAGYEFLSDPVIQNITREDAELFIDECIVYLRGELRGNKKNIGLVIKKSLQYKQLLQSNNLNPQLTIDNMLIFLKRKS